ncbi:endolytic transglycosylase MltG [Cytobacillus gottheilii]|uniref:Endolytic transglycosylase MltG n=1 Tax=Cytobacillus gottheilii TaxID=859144 RepID=A0ABX8F7D4_9BACI|nr:endolytic transglycosylase MltG [Cytobacillus gottheilii]QVY60348.1 endolytic transglycosylase MltG [Cytobacillus gottheilii]
MHKRNVRSFSFGIFFSVLVIAIYTFIADPEREETAYTDNGAKAYLEEAGYTVLTEEELNNAIDSSEKQTEQPDTDSNDGDEAGSNPDQPQGEDTAPEEPPVSFELEISQGMNVGQIASLLVQVGLVEDASAFTQYMEENGYSTKIQLGTFEIKQGMSIEEIAKTITKS